MTHSDDGEPASFPESAPHVRAARHWERRGYTIRYADEHLVQLARGSRSTWRVVLYTVLAVPLLVLALALARQGMRRQWHIISLASDGSRRVVYHQQWTDRLPPL